MTIHESLGYPIFRSPSYPMLAVTHCGNQGIPINQYTEITLRVLNTANTLVGLLKLMDSYTVLMVCFMRTVQSPHKGRLEQIRVSGTWGPGDERCSGVR